MKNNTRIVAALIATGLASPMAYATNGDEMMAVGAQNTALGGTGVANYVGAESTFANPAMLGKSTARQIVFGAAYFKPTVTNTGMTGTTPETSSANPNVIPDISYSSRINTSLTYGIAMAGIAGMGVDYTGASPAYVSAKTAMSILRVVPTLAYNGKNFGLGFSPVMQYGSLAISYDATAGGGAAVNTAQNADTSTGYGFAAGAYFNTTSLTMAIAYQSAIEMSYGKQLSAAGAGFGQTFADKLAQPAQAKAGFAYTTSNNRFTLTADYKAIQWSSATGYKEFGWKDQGIASVGAKFAGEKYWFGLGYNNTDNPIPELANGTLTPAGNNAGIVNMFNNLMFPGIVKSAYTLGAGFSMTKSLDFEIAAMVAPEVKSTVDISDAAAAPSGTLSNTTTHSQQSASMSLRYKF